MGKLLSSANRESKKRLHRRVFQRPSEHPLEDAAISGDIEKDDASDVRSLGNILRDADNALRKINDKAYAVTVVFTTADQCRAFMKAAGWDAISDDSRAFVDGIALAEQMGVEIPKESIRLLGKRSEKDLIPLIQES